MELISSVLVDLDGTICNTAHRQHLIKGEEGSRDWEAYSMACEADEVIDGVASVVRLLNHSHQVTFVSGRNEQARDLTLNWLEKYNLWRESSKLVLRPEGDRRNNVDYKCWVVEGLINEFRSVPALAIDDYPAVLEALYNRFLIPGLLVPSNDRRYDMVALERAGVLTGEHLDG